MDMILMTDKSIIIDWTRPVYFNKQLNVGFQLSKMDGVTNNFTLILTKTEKDNFSDYVDTTTGKLKSDVEVSKSVDLKLSYIPLLYGTDGHIRFTEETSISFSDTESLNLRAIFLRQKDTGMVGFYCIYNNSFPISNKLTIPKDTHILEFKGEMSSL